VVADGQGTNNFKVTFHLSGSKPNYEFTAGVHLFNPANITARPNVSGFGGLPLVGEGLNGRDGKSAYGIAYDFGSLKTNASGDGFAALPAHRRATTQLGLAGYAGRVEGDLSRLSAGAELKPST